MSVKSPRIPGSVIRRLPVYLRHLEQLRDGGISTVSSLDLGNQLDSNPAQIRKDLAFFGEFGRKGVGYDVAYLIDKIRQILRLDRELRVALVGAGHLGIALCHHSQSRPSNLIIAYAFDKDPGKVGLQIGPIIVHRDAELERKIKQDEVRMAIIAVPPDQAQSVADRLVEAGVSAILNFAPVLLRVPSHIHVRNADFASELQALAYYAVD
ncbi:redox-sensing transcriptional repressor Rex [Alicyclobacillus tolerans]|uniref:redox-sensing transcriptional repressor Rex n=1 Tax=Alicyclobacillus tolerans TaxID=90970 RepID=UPI001F31959E|nr:redox-sensing transcriptional repressor Rex [Alicyclobacillus tolerans]MCF8563787.1 redox-sensing transcriptional repressor Rex [Alicyclobacillus tolerans]